MEDFVIGLAYFVIGVCFVALAALVGALVISLYREMFR